MVIGSQTGIDLSYRVRFDECGPDGRLPASGFLRYAQDLAWVHSDGAGFGRQWYGDRGLTWLIRAIELDLLEGVTYGERLEVTTEVLGFRRVWARRRSEFRRSDSERTVAVALIDWVLLGPTGVPTRVPAEIVNVFPNPAATFTPVRIHLPQTPADATSAELTARRSELDPMAHVNNAAYLDYIDELLVAAGRGEQLVKLPRRYRVEFVWPAEPGLGLRASGWQDQLSWCFRLESQDGRELVRARVETDPATWVGA